MASVQIRESKRTQDNIRIIRGILWHNWLRTESAICFFFGLWFVLGFLFQCFTHPNIAIAFLIIYAGVIASLSAIDEKEFHFSLPPTRTQQYYSRTVIGLTTTLWLSAATLLTFALDLPQVIWQHIGSATFARPFEQTSTGWYSYALILVLPMMGFISSYISYKFSIRNRFVTCLFGVLYSYGCPISIFMVGISIEWLIWKNGPSFRDGITTGYISIPLMILTGILALKTSLNDLKKQGAVKEPGKAVKIKWKDNVIIAAFTIIYICAWIMYLERIEHQAEMQKKEKVTSVHFRQVSDKGNYPRWQGYSREHDKSLSHENIRLINNLKLLLIFFLLIIPLFSWHAMHRWFSDSGLILKKRRIPLPRPAIMILVIIAVTALGLVAWNTMSTLRQQYGMYREAFDQTMLIPTLPLPVPEKPAEGNRLEMDQARFLVQTVMIQKHGMHPVCAKTYDIRGPLESQAPIWPDLKPGMKTGTESEMTLEQVMWEWRDKNTDGLNTPLFSVRTYSVYRPPMRLTTDGPDSTYKSSLQSADNALSLWPARAAWFVGFAVPVSEDDPLKEIPVSEWLSQKQGIIGSLLYNEKIDYPRHSPIMPAIIKWADTAGMAAALLVLLAGACLAIAFRHYQLALPVCLTLAMIFAAGLDAWCVREQEKILGNTDTGTEDRKCAAMMLDSSFFYDAKAKLLLEGIANDPRQPETLKHTISNLLARHTINPEDDWPLNIIWWMKHPSPGDVKQLLDWANASPLRLYIPEETSLIAIRESADISFGSSFCNPKIPGRQNKIGLSVYRYLYNYMAHCPTELPKGLQYEQLSWDGQYVHMRFKVRPAYAEKLEISSEQAYTAMLTFDEIMGRLSKRNSRVYPNIFRCESPCENRELNVISALTERARRGPPMLQDG